MNDQEIQEYKALYLQTAREYLEMLTRQLPSIHAVGVIDDLFRAAHSLKSQSLVMQYTQTGILAGLLEKIFRAVKDGSLVISADLQSALQDALGVLTASMESIDKTNNEVDTATIVVTLEKLTGQKMLV